MWVEELKELGKTLIPETVSLIAQTSWPASSRIASSIDSRLPHRFPSVVVIDPARRIVVSFAIEKALAAPVSDDIVQRCSAIKTPEMSKSFNSVASKSAPCG